MATVVDWTMADAGVATATTLASAVKAAQISIHPFVRFRADSFASYAVAPREFYAEPTLSRVA